MSRPVSKQIAIAHKLYTRRGKRIHFLRALCLLFQKKFKMGSISIPSKILASPLGKICRDGVVFTLNVSLSTFFGGITSHFVVGVFRGTE